MVWWFCFFKMTKMFVFSNLWLPSLKIHFFPIWQHFNDKITLQRKKPLFFMQKSTHFHKNNFWFILTLICKYVVHPNRHGFRFFFETENRFFLGGIVEARAEHKNFLTKYHWSFCSNVQMFKIFKMFKMLCAKQESFFRAGKERVKSNGLQYFSNANFWWI